MKKLLLAFDGGGTRGFLSVLLLKQVLISHPKLLDKVSLISGTSIGSINACSLAFGKSLEDLEKFYYNYVPRIFSPKRFPVFSTAANIFNSKYSNKPLQDALTNIFGVNRLNKLKKDVLIPTWNISQDRAHYFDTQGFNEEITHVCMASAAIPAYFPVYKGPHGDLYLDGGVAANNPSIVSLAQVLNPENGYDTKLEDVHILSIGTGIAPRANNKFRGLNMGARDIIKRRELFATIVLDAPNESTAYAAKQILGDRYFRLNLDIPKLPLDSYETVIKSLDLIKQGKANKVVNQCVAWLDKFIDEVK